MSAGITTINGASVPSTFTTALGNAAFTAVFNQTAIVSEIYGSGSASYTVGGSSSYPAATGITGSGLSVAVTGATSIAITGSSDSVFASGATPYTAFLSTGSVLGQGSGSSTVYAGTGSSTIAGGTGSTTVVGGSGSLLFIGGSSNNDSVTAGSGSTTIDGASVSNSTLVGGSGVTTIVLTGSSTGDLVVGGAGITLIDASATTGAFEIATNPLGNSGSLIATLGSGSDSVIGGSGNSVIQAGSGNDVFGFVRGHAGGAETILGFNSHDNLAFGGYNYSLTSPPTETIAAVGDVITLSDGTTITLAGIDHKIF